jgi:hypothetical protein
MQAQGVLAGSNSHQAELKKSKQIGSKSHFVQGIASRGMP